MPKKLLPESNDEKMIAWQPHLGLFDIRWASALPPFGKAVSLRSTYDKDLDLDLDVKFYGETI